MSKKEIIILVDKLTKRCEDLIDENADLCKQLEAVHSEEVKVPIKDLPYGTFFELSNGEIYVKVNGGVYDAFFVSAIGLNSEVYLCQKLNQSILDSTQYTIIPNPFKTKTND